MNKSSVIQVTVDEKTEKQVEFLTKRGGFDNKAATLRSLIRRKYEEVKNEERLNLKTIQHISKGLEDYKKGEYYTNEDIFENEE